MKSLDRPGKVAVAHEIARSSMTRARWMRLLAAGFPSMVFLQLALQLYVANESLLINPGSDAWLMAGGGVACFALLFAALECLGRIGTGIWALACTLALFFLVRELVFPLELPRLDGSSSFPRPGLGYRIAEYALLAILYLGLLALPSRATIQFTSAATVVFALFNLQTVAASGHIFGWSSPPASYEKITRVHPTDQSPLPDIYHLLFDEYQTVEHLFVRRERGVPPFDDFVCFRNNISNYNHTWLSVPSMFTGTLYPPGQDSREWFGSFRRGGLFRALKENGYAIHVFGYNPAWYEGSLADRVRCSQQAARERLAGTASGDHLALVGLRALPSFLGRDVHHQWRKSMQNRDLPPPLHHAFYSTVIYREMVRGVKHLPAGGNYTFVHLILPHAPEVMDEFGNYVGEGEGSRLGQVYCVNRLVGELIDELKRIGRYDRSMIVVHADTGSYFDTDLDKQQAMGGRLRPACHRWAADDRWDGARWPLPVVKARADAALLIKPPGHRGATVVEVPSELRDIPATILTTVGLADAARRFPDSRDLLGNPPVSDRIRRTFVLGTAGARRVPQMQEWLIRNNNFQPGRVVPLTGSPL